MVLPGKNLKDTKLADIKNISVANPQILLPLMVAASRFVRGVSFAAQLGVSSVSWRVLLLLEANGKMRPSEISEAEHTSRATTTAVLKRLEAEKLICRIADLEDRRACFMQLTSHGEQMIKQWRKQVKEVIEELAVELDNSQIEALCTAQKIIEKLNEILNTKMEQDSK